MIDDDTVAVDAERRGVDDPAVVGSLDADVLGDRKIVAEVHLLVDLLAVVDVVAQIGEGGLGLGVRLAREGLGPEELRRGLEAQVGKSLIVGLAHLAVDLDKARHGIAGAVGIEFVDDLIEEGVADLEIVHRVMRLLLLRKLHTMGSVTSLPAPIDA